MMIKAAVLLVSIVWLIWFTFWWFSELRKIEEKKLDDQPDLILWWD